MFVNVDFLISALGLSLVDIVFILNYHFVAEGPQRQTKDVIVPHKLKVIVKNNTNEQMYLVLEHLLTSSKESAFAE